MIKRNKLGLAFLASVCLTAATYAQAGTTKRITGTIEDFYTEVEDWEPYLSRKCSIVEVPVYASVSQKGDPVGGALLGMVLGGLVGKGVSGNDKGAAAGAVFGGLVGADKGSKPKTTQQIVGYKDERICEQVTDYRITKTKMYDYSILTWTVDGVTHKTEVVK
jgi:uncharacterized protein YcfJ|tara:strand:+ start:2964 stop:3452 length:489 start_codon:yes stop_codon:yes gene_type:complete